MPVINIHIIKWFLLPYVGEKQGHYQVSGIAAASAAPSVSGIAQFLPEPTQRHGSRPSSAGRFISSITSVATPPPTREKAKKDIKLKLLDVAVKDNAAVSISLMF